VEILEQNPNRHIPNRKSRPLILRWLQNAQVEEDRFFCFGSEALDG